MNSQKIRVAIVGLGFGAEFIPIYQKHPNAEMVAICQRNSTKLDEIGNALGIKKRYTDYGELLKDPEIDAVHINNPDSQPCRTGNCRSKSGQVRGLYRTDGDHRGGMPTDR